MGKLNIKKVCYGLCIGCIVGIGIGFIMEKMSYPNCDEKFVKKELKRFNKIEEQGIKAGNDPKFQEMIIKKNQGYVLGEIRKVEIANYGKSNIDEKYEKECIGYKSQYEKENNNSNYKINAPFELSNGSYMAGQDIPIGVFDIDILQGKAIIDCGFYTDMLNTDENEGNGHKNFKNLEIKKGDKLTISSSNKAIIKFTPKN